MKHILLALLALTPSCAVDCGGYERQHCGDKYGEQSFAEEETASEDVARDCE